MHWRNEQLTLQMVLATEQHHSRDVGPVRSQKTARAGEWGARDELYGDDPGPLPTPQPELFSLYDEGPGGSRPDRMPTLSGPQERVQRHTVDQIVDAVPGLPTLDAPVPLMVEQLVDVLRFVGALVPVAEQVIEVLKIILENIPSRRLVRDPQPAEQLLDVPTPQRTTLHGDRTHLTRGSCPAALRRGQPADPRRARSGRGLQVRLLTPARRASSLLRRCVRGRRRRRR